MPHHRPLIRISLAFAPADYRVFVTAVRQLRRIMGRNAPDVLTLIQFNLHDRDATGVADDYLDAMRWPNAAGRVVSLRRRRKSNRRSVRLKAHTLPLAFATKTPAPHAGPPGDPSLN